MTRTRVVGGGHDFALLSLSLSLLGIIVAQHLVPAERPSLAQEIPSETKQNY